MVFPAASPGGSCYASRMTRQWRSTGFLLALAVAAAVFLEGCRKPERPNVVAVVGGHKVELESFQGYVTGVLGESWKMADDRLASRLLDQFLAQEAVAAAARRERRFRIPVEPARRSAMVRELIPGLCGPAPTPSPEEVARAVEERLAGPRPRRVHVRQLVLGSREEAQEVRARLAAGEDFTALSRSVSRAPNAADGGELGLLEEGTLPEDLEAVVFGLAPGEISAPVEGPSGWHIFQVLEVLGGDREDRSVVEREVRAHLLEEAARRHTRQCIDRLEAEVGVVVLADHLWFRYDGRHAEEHDVATDPDARGDGGDAGGSGDGG